MNQSRAFIVSLVFAGIAMALVYFYVSDKESSIRGEYGTKVPVVVASRDINELEQIQADMMAVRVVPSSFAQPMSDASPKTFEGLVAAAPFKQGEQILKSKVLVKGAATGLASQVAISRRAISFPVNDVSGVTRLVKPGDRIDIVSNIQYRTENGPESEVKTVMQDVHVLAVGELVQNYVPDGIEKDAIDSNRRALSLRGNRNFGTMTVEVTPQEAQALILIMQGGAELFITLRNPVDRVVTAIPTTSVDEVLGPMSKKAAAARARVPAAAPAAIAPRPSPTPWFKGGASLVN